MGNSTQDTSFNSLPVKILQHLVSYLDFTALLKCRCVCAGWLECIPVDASDLRRILFLLCPTISTPFTPRGYTLYIDIHTDAKSIYSKCRSAKAASTCGINNLIARMPSMGNSIFLHPFGQDMDPYIVAKIPSCLRGSPTFTVSFVSLGNKAGNLVQSEGFAIWKNMLVTSSPVTELYVKFRYVNWDEETIESRSGHGQKLLFNSEGARFVEFFSILETQTMDLLRKETLKLFDKSPQACIQLPELRDRTCDGDSLVY
jgi:hypothetical protein